MRAGKTERIGTSGQSKVKAKFEDLEWGVNPNDDHDLGTDLWLQARDARRFDLGALAGAQVKSSDDGNGSYFSRPTSDKEVDGWWYSESVQDHFKYWTEHAVPHLLVLHNHELDTSYWVHVTKDAVIHTGQGAKILVPASQTLDAAHRDELIAVATSRRSGTMWAGSAWSSENQIFREDRLRFAAIAPRLIAPHPNAMPGTLEPEQAIALLTQMRLHDLDAGHNPDRTYPTIEEAQSSANWRWRLYASLYQYLEKGDPHSFDPVTTSAATSEERTASSAIQAACFMESGHCQDAERVLRNALAHDDASPADNAWLQVQLSRCLRDLGDPTNAQRIALEIQRLRQSAPDDPTVLAICGAAADIVFSTSPLGNGNLAETIVGRDTPPAWWRSQVLATGLIDHFADDFKRWADDQSITFGKSDTAWLKLRAVSLMSGFAGDHQNWRHSLSLLAQRQLMTCGDSSIKPVVEALNDLRWAGDKTPLGHAIRRIVLDGPGEAVQLAAKDIDLTRSTRTSIQCDIAFLTQAADVLDTSTADRALNWALQIISDPQPFAEHYHPTFLVWDAVLKLLTAVVPAGSAMLCRQVIDHILQLPVQTDQHRARLNAWLFEAIPDRAWANEDLARLKSRVGDRPEIRDAIDSILAENDDATRQRLIEKVRSGSVAALDALPDVRILDHNAAKSVINVLINQLIKQRDLAHQGSFSAGGRDLGRTIALLNVWHPNAAQWEPIIELLADPSTAADHLAGTLAVLSWTPEQIPSSVAERILPLLSHLMQHAPIQNPISTTDVRGLAAEARDALRPGALTREELWSLMRGTSNQRSSAVLIIARRKNPGDIDLLASFSRDDDVHVRGAVVSSLVGWIHEDVSSEEAEGLLVELLQEPGTRAARTASRTLANLDQGILSRCPSLAAVLQDHISVAVRRSSLP